MDNARFNKLLNEKYYLLKSIAKKYNYPEEILDMITFIYISFYMDFGKKVDYPLYDLFDRVRIVYGVGTVNEVSLSNGYEPIEDGTAAVTLFKPNLKVFDNPDLKQEPQTIILGTHVGDCLATPALKLEMLIHEIRHALMGYYNTNILLDENTYYMRTGLQETFYRRNLNIFKKYNVEDVGEILDEVINTYMSEFLLHRIMSFKRYKIDNPDLRRYIQSLKSEQVNGKYRAFGYELEVNLCAPLLLSPMFCNLTNNHQFDGEIEIVKNFININTDLCDYLTFCNLLDTISKDNIEYEKAIANNNVDFVNNHITNIERAKAIILDLRKNIGE